MVAQKNVGLSFGQTACGGDVLEGSRPTEGGTGSLWASVPSQAQTNSKSSESLQLLWSPWYHMNDRVKNNSPVVTFPFFRLSLRPVPNTVRYSMTCLKYKMLFTC